MYMYLIFYAVILSKMLRDHGTHIYVIKSKENNIQMLLLLLLFKRTCMLLEYCQTFHDT